MNQRKKLIEVALPLEAINAASAREKSIRHGHPSTLHLWWARRPLAAARAVIFASLVDDPNAADAPPAFVRACEALPAPHAVAPDKVVTPRDRLFSFIEQLVTWEKTTNDDTLETARALIRLSNDGNVPPLLDPFAGGGSIPLEAQRLGLEAHASDLNPVAVMINKAQIEIPPRFAHLPPVNPHDRAGLLSAKGKQDTTYRGAAGLAADVRYYGEWMRARAWERVGHLYPTHQGETVVAWLWARTVKSPNPAVNAHVPLVRSFELNKKKDKRAWVEPQIVGGQVTFAVRREQDGDDPKTIQQGTMLSKRGGVCLISGEPIPFDYIRAEGKAGRMGAVLMAIVTDGKGGRNYHSPTPEHQHTAESAVPAWKPVAEIIGKSAVSVPLYGVDTYDKLFTPRQLVALTTFSDLVAEARAQAHQDALAAGLADDNVPLRDGGRGALAYAQAVSVYLAFAVDRLADRCNAFTRWEQVRDSIANLFARQAISMIWDYAEGNPFSSSTGNWLAMIDGIYKALAHSPATNNGFVQQQDATQLAYSNAIALSTDPPYYDMISYADLSDFFYIWMRHSLRAVYPDLFSTLLAPKASELVATPYRFDGNKKAANAFFEDGMVKAFSQMRRFVHPDYPLTIYYAFKQQESDEVEDVAYDAQEEALPSEGSANGKAKKATVRASTGWETMLNGILRAGFAIVGTYPMRTERSVRINSIGTNALASSIVIVCRPRPQDAPNTTRRHFMEALRQELPQALEALQSCGIAPVDLAQASIGPGMAIYSRYRQVLEADGTPLDVRTALKLINKALDLHLADQDGALDEYSQFAVAWFESFGFAEGDFGTADTLARAKNTSVEGVKLSGVLRSKGGKVQLIHWQAYDDWDPEQDKRPTVWEATHHLIKRLNVKGEGDAALLMDKMPTDMAAQARELAYRMYNICERKKWADLARDYNELVTKWFGITDALIQARQSHESGFGTKQESLFD